MAVREYNEAVRSLASFVKKRDVRYKPIIQNDFDRQKALRDAARAQAIRSRAANKERLDSDSMAGWATPVRPEDNAEQLTGDDDSEESRVQYECIVCKKSFKSEQQYEAHGKSKKHLKAVQSLRLKLQKESQDLDLDGSTAQGLQSQAGQAEASSGTQSPVSPSVREYQSDAARHSCNGAEAEVMAESTSERFSRLNVGSNVSPVQDTQEGDLSHKEPPASSDLSASLKEDKQEPIGLEQVQAMENAAGGIGFEQDSSCPTGESTPTLRDESDSIQKAPELGKAKKKRAKKASQQAVAVGSSSSEVTEKILMYFELILIMDFSCNASHAETPSRQKHVCLTTSKILVTLNLSLQTSPAVAIRDDAPMIERQCYYKTRISRLPGFDKDIFKLEPRSCLGETLQQILVIPTPKFNTVYVYDRLQWYALFIRSPAPRSWF